MTHAGAKDFVRQQWRTLFEPLMGKTSRCESPVRELLHSCHEHTERQRSTCLPGTSHGAVNSFSVTRWLWNLFPKTPTRGNKRFWGDPWCYLKHLLSQSSAKQPRSDAKLMWKASPVTVSFPTSHYSVWLDPIAPQLSPVTSTCPCLSLSLVCLPIIALVSSSANKRRGCISTQI